ncbi:hypothetical protein LXA43DRAFT_209495 [Ganoderma leucocontextum]|nr:hypothetical protein LXA43DRAFT_209495 [Ganoderma leucocontextum]
MNLSKVVAQAPKRSPTPHEKAHHGSSSKAATPAIDGIVRSKSSGRMSPPPNPDDPSSVPLAAAQPKCIPVPTYRPSAPYQGGIGSAFASTSRGNPNPLTSGLGGRPPTLTMTFPSAMAYSNLSPSNFAGQPPPLGRAAPPGIPGLSGNNSSVMFEFSEFAPQPWQVPALSRPGGAPVVPGAGAGGGSGGVPTTLETTDDLVRYLEHRTRLTAAGQSNDSDFM